MITVALVLGASALTADRVTTQLRQIATDEAAQGAAAIVGSFVAPLLSEDAMQDRNGPTGTALNDELSRLVETGYFLRIKVWDKTGTIVFSDLPALRGRQFEVEEDLEHAFDGEVESDITDGSAAENEFEHGLAPRLLEIYSPVRLEIDRRGRRRIRDLPRRVRHRGTARRDAARRVPHRRRDRDGPDDPAAARVRRHVPADAPPEPSTPGARAHAARSRGPLPLARPERVRPVPRGRRGRHDRVRKPRRGTDPRVRPHRAHRPAAQRHPAPRGRLQRHDAARYDRRAAGRRRRR